MKITNMGYVYRHVRLDKNEVFYIGVSKQNNNYMRARQTHKRNKFWKNIVSKTEFRYDILWESESDLEILAKESEFISLYGRKDLGTGTLCNLTDGGEGVHNYKHTDEAKIRMAKSRENRDFSTIYTQEVRLKMRNALLGKKRTAEQVAKLSLLRKGKGINGDNNNSKLVLDCETGIFYECAKEAAVTYNINYTTFKQRVQGKVKSNKRFIYA